MEARKAGYWKEGWMDVAANPTNVQGTSRLSVAEGVALVTRSRTPVYGSAPYQLVPHYGLSLPFLETRDPKAPLKLGPHSPGTDSANAGLRCS